MSSSEGERRPTDHQDPSASLHGINSELRRIGFESSELVIGVDFTKSNLTNGTLSFEGKSLHDVDVDENHYQKTLRFISDRLGRLDDDALIPCYGFGDVSTGSNAVFSFRSGDKPIKGLHAVAERYKEIVSLVDMDGPTSFAPLIRQAMRVVHRSGMKFHILLILADGQVSSDCLAETKAAIATAASFPISIVMIGIGDGPWEEMQEFDNGLPERNWDNFHFVEFNKIMADPSEDAQKKAFEAKVMEELSQHFVQARRLTGEHNVRAMQRIINDIPLTNLIGPPMAPVHSGGDWVDEGFGDGFVDSTVRL